MPWGGGGCREEWPQTPGRRSRAASLASASGKAGCAPTRSGRCCSFCRSSSSRSRSSPCPSASASTTSFFRVDYFELTAFRGLGNYGACSTSPMVLSSLAATLDLLDLRALIFTMTVGMGLALHLERDTPLARRGARRGARAVRDLDARRLAAAALDLLEGRRNHERRARPARPRRPRDPRRSRARRWRRSSSTPCGATAPSR